MTTTKPPPTQRLNLTLNSTDLAAIEAAAMREDISRASWAKRTLRARLRALAAADTASATA